MGLVPVAKFVSLNFSKMFIVKGESSLLVFGEGSFVVDFLPRNRTILHAARITVETLLDLGQEGPPKTTLICFGIERLSLVWDPLKMPSRRDTVFFGFDLFLD